MKLTENILILLAVIGKSINIYQKTGWLLILTGVVLIVISGIRRKSIFNCKIIVL